MELSTKNKVIIVVVYTAAAVAVGRFSAPEKIKIETKTVEVEKKSDAKDDKTSKDVHKKTTTKVIKKPDGEVDEDTTTTEDDVSKTDNTDHSTDDLSKTTDKTKEVSKSSSHLNLALLGGLNVFNPTSSGPVYGISASRNLVGPITIGIWGFQTGLAGCSVGLEF